MKEPVYFVCRALYLWQEGFEAHWLLPCSVIALSLAEPQLPQCAITLFAPLERVALFWAPAGIPQR